MANGKSERKTALDNAAVARNGDAPFTKFEYAPHVLRDAINILGTEEAAQYHDLGEVMLPCVVVPELSRVRIDGTGTINCAFKLQKLIGTTRNFLATWTRSTTTATVTLANHGYVTGQVLAVTVSSSEAAIVIGNVTITRTGKNTFTFTCLNAGDASGTITIGAAAGTAVDLTSAVTCDGSGVEQFAVVANTQLPLLEADDSIIATFTDVTTIPSTRRLLLEIATYRRTG